MPAPFGAMLWLRYVLDAEAASRDIPRIFTSYDRLLNQPATELTRLIDFFGLNTGAAVSEQAVNFASKDLVSVAPRTSSQALPPWHNETLAILEELAQRPASATTVESDLTIRLDSIGTELGRATSALWPLIDSDSADGSALRRASKELEAIKADLQRLKSGAPEK
jgi:hypothetical protein